MQIVTVLDVGTPIISYNRLTGFETAAFLDEFVVLNVDEIGQLKPGDEIYIGIDSFYGSGEVRGKFKVNVRKLELISDGKFRIYYRSSRWNGFETAIDGVCLNVYKAKNEKTLAAIVSRLPLSMVYR